MSARGAIRDYQCTSSTTQMLQDVNWRALEQRRIDSCFSLMYKIIYDLIAIHAADYLIPNTRQSKHNHLVAYRQIPTLKDYYKYIFFPRTIVHRNALPFHIPILPTMEQLSHAVYQEVHFSMLISNVLLPFNYTKPLPFTCILFLYYSPHLFN